MVQTLIGIILSFCVASVPRTETVQAQNPTLDASLSVPHLVDIESDRRLNVFCLGEGVPTVLFEQGGEGNIGNWKAVQPAISAITRTCFYDRAGFGYSDSPGRAVTALNVTDDLRALLIAEKIEGPVVLVGHSVGGFYATVYADRFREDVAGLVLVDPGFSGQEQWRTANDFESEFPNIRRGEDGLLNCARLARGGELTAETLRANGCFPVSDQLPAGERRYLLHAVTGPDWYEAEYSQSINFFSRNESLSVSHSEEASLRRGFDEMPIEVLSAAKPPSSSWREPDRRHVAGLHWQDGHRQLAGRSTQGRWRIVEGSGHFIQLDQPQAVIASIERVVRQVRKKSEQ